jgi:DNA-directed RNA polymerase specialized sigma subunit
MKAEEWLLRFVFDCDTLEDRDRIVAEMRDDGMSVDEIAGALEITPFRVTRALLRVDSGRYGAED